MDHVPARSVARPSLAEFRELMGPLARGISDADLARWQSRLDRLAELLVEWDDERERDERLRTA